MRKFVILGIVLAMAILVLLFLVRNGPSTDKCLWNQTRMDPSVVSDSELARIIIGDWFLPNTVWVPVKECLVHGWRPPGP